MRLYYPNIFRQMCDQRDNKMYGILQLKTRGPHSHQFSRHSRTEVLKVDHFTSTHRNSTVKPNVKRIILSELAHIEETFINEMSGQLQFMQVRVVNTAQLNLHTKNSLFCLSLSSLPFICVSKQQNLNLNVYKETVRPHGILVYSLAT